MACDLCKQKTDRQLPSCGSFVYRKPRGMEQGFDRDFRLAESHTALKTSERSAWSRPEFLQDSDTDRFPAPELAISHIFRIFKQLVQWYATN